tara:strand:- start:49 stop:270 length:222 start_codon:yes stop_codon:yes gene_type:complete
MKIKGVSVSLPTPLEELISKTEAASSADASSNTNDVTKARAYGRTDSNTNDYADTRTHKPREFVPVFHTYSLP